MTPRQESLINPREFERLCNEHVPSGGRIRVESLEAGAAIIRLPFQEENLRPGGTLSGPVQMALADVAMYGVVLSLIGRVELAVTTNLNINFLRRPVPGDLIAQGRILKLGKRLAVGEVAIYSEQHPDPVAHATLTYSIPPERAGG